MELLLILGLSLVTLVVTWAVTLALLSVLPAWLVLAGVTSGCLAWRRLVMRP